MKSYRKKTMKNKTKKNKRRYKLKGGVHFESKATGKLCPKCKLEHITCQYGLNVLPESLCNCGSCSWNGFYKDA